MSWSGGKHITRVLPFVSLCVVCVCSHLSCLPSSVCVAAYREEEEDEPEVSIDRLCVVIREHHHTTRAFRDVPLDF